jgi:hypothetical protein
LQKSVDETGGRSAMGTGLGSPVVGEQFPDSLTSSPPAAQFRGHHVLARANNLAGLVDTFLVSAVVCLVVTRSWLALSHYPRVGGNGLHVSHMLWGGLLLTIALLSQLSYVGRASKLPAAVIGGIGFGLFIDEIGKFVTSNNDYFFKPTFALVYVALVAIYFLIQTVIKHKDFEQDEYLANAFDLAIEASLGRLDRPAQRMALEFLDQAGDDELSRGLRTLVENAPVHVHRSRFSAVLTRLNRWYDLHRTSEGFRLLLLGVFAAQVLLLVGEFAAISLLVRHAWQDSSSQVLNQTSTDTVGLSFVAVIELGTAVVCAVFVTVGIRRLKQDRVRAYRMFERSLLLSMFVTQVLAFFQSWGISLAAMLSTLAVWIMLRLMVQREEITGDAQAAIE